MKVKCLNVMIFLVISTSVLLTLVLGVGWVSHDTYGTVVRTQYEQMDNLTKNSVSTMRDYIGQVKVVNGLLAADKAVVRVLQGRGAGSADRLFKSFLGNSNKYWAAFVFDRSGKVISGYTASGTNLKGADHSSREYVQKIAAGQQAYLSGDIIKSKTAGKYIFASAHAVRSKNGKILGGVVIYPLWDIFCDTFVDPVHIGKSGYAYVLDRSGRVIAHGADKNLLLKDVSGHKFVRNILEEKKGTIEYEWEGVDKVVTFDTLNDTGWTMILTAAESDLAAPAIKQRNTLAVGGIIAGALLVTGLVLLMRRIVVSPIQSLLAYSTTVAGGDFSAELEGDFRFQMKGLADNVQEMVVSLKNRLALSEGVLNGMTSPCGIISPEGQVLWANKPLCDILENGIPPGDIERVPAGVFFFGDASRETLSEKSIRQRKALKVEIEYTSVKGTSKYVRISTTPFYSMDGEILGAITSWTDLTEVRNQTLRIEEQNKRIAVAVEEASDISRLLSSAASQLSSQISEANHGSGIQRERAAETATAMEEMNATVVEVSRSALQSAGEVDEAMKDARNGENIVTEVVDSVGGVASQAQSLRISMQELGKQAEGIGDVMSVITDIADQTNLLALNAAIEAARAGEAGRGFAVVADEVRKLAEKTVAATSEVGSTINTIQSMTGESIRATENAADSISRSAELARDSGEALRRIVTRVEAASGQVQAIATATEQQTATSEEINRATEEINRISNDNSQVMNEAEQAITEVSDMAVRLNDVIARMGA